MAAGPKPTVSSMAMPNFTANLPLTSTPLNNSTSGLRSVSSFHASSQSFISSFLALCGSVCRSLLVRLDLDDWRPSNSRDRRRLHGYAWRADALKRLLPKTSVQFFSRPYQEADVFGQCQRSRNSRRNERVPHHKAGRRGRSTLEGHGHHQNTDGHSGRKRNAQPWNDMNENDRLGRGGVGVFRGHAHPQAEPKERDEVGEGGQSTKRAAQQNQNEIKRKYF